MTGTLVAYVPTAEGEAALTCGITAAQRMGGSLRVLNVVQGDVASDPRTADDDDVAAVRARCAEAGVELQWLQRTGDEPVEAVLRAIRDSGADVLVIGIRRRSAVGKLLMGSVAQQLLLRAECAVLAVKAG